MLMTRHFDYCPSASEGDNQSVRSSAPVVSRCFPGGYNVKLYISRGRLAWWLLIFLHSDRLWNLRVDPSDIEPTMPSGLFYEDPFPEIILWGPVRPLSLNPPLFVLDLHKLCWITN